MRAKSLLLTPVLFLLMLITGVAIYQLVTHPSPLPWLGVFLAASPLPYFITTLMVSQSIARTTPTLPITMAISGFGALFAVFSGLAVTPQAAILAAISFTALV